MGKQEASAAAGSTHLLAEGEFVWRLLLQHAWQPLAQAVVCKLLCCSQAMTADVHSSCQHRLAVQLHQHPQHSGRLIKQLNKWLQKHQNLVCQLLFTPTAAAPSATQAPPQPHSVPAAVAALQQQCLRLARLSAPAVPLLPSPLSPTGLTRLDWAISIDSKPRAFAKSLLHLSSLRSLALSCVDSSSPGATSAHMGSFEDLAPAVHTLTAITALHLQHFSISRSASQQLPASLQVLTVGPPLPRLYARATREQQQLQLQHLTALQELELHSLRGCDVLPAQLRSLRVHHCSVLPLLPLKLLQQLHITGDAPEVVLGQLSCMQSLQELHLAYSSWGLSAAGVKHLQELPLRGLRCALTTEQLAVLGQVGAKGKLAHLHVQLAQGLSQPGQGSRGGVGSSWQGELAQQLRQLPTLKTLVIEVLQQQQPQGCRHLPSAAAAADAAGATAAVGTAADAVCAAICSLPVLQELRLVGLQLLPDDAAQLAAATQLTHLAIPYAVQVAAVPAGAAHPAAYAAPAVTAAAAAVAASSKVARLPDQGCSSCVTVVVHHV